MKGASMLYRLSKLIPVRMRSVYGSAHYCEATDSYHEMGPRRSTWWQWRGRIIGHRQTVIGGGA